jgi:hypothetical protein
LTYLRVEVLVSLLIKALTSSKNALTSSKVMPATFLALLLGGHLNLSTAAWLGCLVRAHSVAVWPVWCV